MDEEIKTQADRRELLAREARKNRLLTVLECRIWPGVPAELLGRTIDKAAVEEILGFGPDGV